MMCIHDASETLWFTIVSATVACSIGLSITFILIEIGNASQTRQISHGTRIHRLDGLVNSSLQFTD